MNRWTIFWGIILLLLGTLFLLDNLGIIQGINIWGLIWPVILITLGVLTLIGASSRRTIESQHVSVPLEGAASARLRLNHGAGRLRIQGGALGAALVDGDFSGGLDVERRQDGSRLDVKLSSRFDFFAPNWWGRGSSLDWLMTVNRETPLELEINMGANEAVLNLNDTRLSRLVVNTGASSTKITLPANAGSTAVKVEGGAMSVEIEVPAGVAARIRTQGGLSSEKIDTRRFPLSGGVYESPDFATAANRVEIEATVGMGSLEIR